MTRCCVPKVFDNQVRTRRMLSDLRSDGSTSFLQVQLKWRIKILKINCLAIVQRIRCNFLASQGQSKEFFCKVGTENPFNFLRTTRAKAFLIAFRSALSFSVAGTLTSSDPLEQAQLHSLRHPPFGCPPWHARQLHPPGRLPADACLVLLVPPFAWALRGAPAPLVGA